MSEPTQPKQKFSHHCEKCDYTATRPKEWLLHIETKKHIRGGGAKPKICTICNEEFVTHWMCKMHILKIHESKEVRAKCKYYCAHCDLIFYAQKYLDKHINGKIHQNLMKALESIKN